MLPFAFADSGVHQSAAGTPGVVLVVDDDAAVREIIADCLAEGGYSVLQADSRPAALRLLSEVPDIVMMITDIRMPDMSGIELAEAALKLRALKIILVSGYFHSQPVTQRFLRKPFRLRELQAAVQAELRT